jgi:hypothetical protein
MLSNGTKPGSDTCSDWQPGVGFIAGTERIPGLTLKRNAQRCLRQRRLAAALAVHITAALVGSPCAQVATSCSNEPELTLGNNVFVPSSPSNRPRAFLEHKDGKKLHAMFCPLWYGYGASENGAVVESYISHARGKRPALIGYFCHCGSNGAELKWSARHQHVLNDLWDNFGAITQVKFYTSSKNTSGSSAPLIRWNADSIIAGKHDAYFIDMADAMRAFGKPVILSMNHEMNGDWYYFSEVWRNNVNGVNPYGWTAETYIGFWRHVHDIFRDQGATNVAFAWCPGARGRKIRGLNTAESLKLFYPGDAYVDWIGLSVYSTVPPEIMDNASTLFPDKPIFVSEGGADTSFVKWYCQNPPAAYPGAGEWMRRLMHALMYRDRNAISYFYYNFFNSGDNYCLTNTGVPQHAQYVRTYLDSISTPMFYHGPVDLNDLNMTGGTVAAGAGATETATPAPGGASGLVGRSGFTTRVSGYKACFDLRGRSVSRLKPSAGVKIVRSGSKYAPSLSLILDDAGRQTE